MYISIEHTVHKESVLTVKVDEFLQVRKELLDLFIRENTLLRHGDLIQLRKEEEYVGRVGERRYTVCAGESEGQLGEIRGVKGDRGGGRR